MYPYEKFKSMIIKFYKTICSIKELSREYNVSAVLPINGLNKFLLLPQADTNITLTENRHRKTRYFPFERGNGINKSLLP